MEHILTENLPAEKNAAEEEFSKDGDCGSFYFRSHKEIYLVAKGWLRPGNAQVTLEITVYR